nr:unnamed protein product [Digitaria exilis]
MMSSLSSALSALHTTGSGGGGVQGQGRRRRRASAVAGSAGPQRRTNTRRRSHSPFLKMVTTSTLDDMATHGESTGKNTFKTQPNPRSYYRCTHRPDQGYRATRQVQTSDDNPSQFVISYYGQHTCRDPSTVPLVIDAGAPPDCANLISFGSTTTTMGASTSTHVGATIIPPQQAFDPTSMLFVSRLVGYSSSLPSQLENRCGSEEVHSSCSPASELAAVVGSAGMTSSATVGSAPAEYWPGDMACGPAGTASFLSSPSSLGIVTGSFGSFWERRRRR